MGKKFEYGSGGPKKVMMRSHDGRQIEVAEQVAKVVEAQRAAENKSVVKVEKKG